MKLSKWTLLGIIVIIVLILIWIGEITGVITYRLLIANFWILLISLVGIAILSIIGAIFVGMFITHRIFSRRGFTPFEEEMLRMREDIKVIKKKLENIGKKRG